MNPVKKLLLLATLPFLPGACLTAQVSPARVLTDTQGRSISATILSSNETHVQIRRTDGGNFSIPLATLSTADRAHISQLADDLVTKAATTSIRINVSRYKNTKRTTAASHFEEAGYSIFLANDASCDIDDLRVEYRLYATKGFSSPTCYSTPGRFDLELLEKKSTSKNFSTKPHNLVVDRTSYWSPGSRQTDTLDGIWIRVYRGKTQVQEYLSNESLRKRGWDEDR